MTKEQQELFRAGREAFEAGIPYSSAMWLYWRKGWKHEHAKAVKTIKRRGYERPIGSPALKRVASW